MRHLSLMLALFLCVTVTMTGCDSHPAKAADETPSVAPQEAVTTDCQGTENSEFCGSEIAHATEPVELTAEGSRFDPPIEVEQVPSGAFYCDMGTVHYASLEQGDNACPVCGMLLTQQPSEDEDADSQLTTEPSGHGH